MKIEFDPSEVVDWFKHIEDGAPEIATELSEALAETILEGAIANAPVDTGALRDSIVRVEEGEGQISIEVGAEYAAYVEHGTSRMAPQPFLQPAIDAAESQMGDLLKAVLDRYD